MTGEWIVEILPQYLDHISNALMNQDWEKDLMEAG